MEDRPTGTESFAPTPMFQDRTPWPQADTDFEIR